MYNDNQSRYWLLVAKDWDAVGNCWSWRAIDFATGKNYWLPEPVAYRWWRLAKKREQEAKDGDEDR